MMATGQPKAAFLEKQGRKHSRISSIKIEHRHFPSAGVYVIFIDRIAFWRCVGF